MPSASRRPIITNSSRRSAALSRSRSAMPSPAVSTAASHFSGALIARVACGAAGAAEPAVGAGADAEVVGAAPDGEVVAAFAARPGVVGDLVGGRPAPSSIACVAS